jgi:hypothetical protein
VRFRRRPRLEVEIVSHERVGKDWSECERCGFKNPPDRACPFCADLVAMGWKLEDIRKLEGA